MYPDHYKLSSLETQIFHKHAPRIFVELLWKILGIPVIYTELLLVSGVFFFLFKSTLFGLFIPCKSFEGIFVTDKFEFSGGRGKRGRGGHRPSGLTGKQIGLWYRDKGKQNRELKQV